MKKGSNTPPPDISKSPAPPPPPPPPGRQIGVFGETKASIKARQDYEIYMSGYRAGFDCGRLISNRKEDI